MDMGLFIRHVYVRDARDGDSLFEDYQYKLVTPSQCTAQTASLASLLGIFGDKTPWI